MNLKLPSPRVRTLAALIVTAAALTYAAALGTAAQKKTSAQKKASAQQKPSASKVQGQPKTGVGQQPQARQVTGILVRWEGKPGVNRYRLQLATDEKFEDVVFDKAVEGRQYVVQGLPPGDYFWRVAPAAAETSPAYTQPERVSLTGSSDKVEVASVVLPADANGWRTATGDVMRLVPAQLRTGGVVDFVGVGADGRAFAVDGASGISLWTARFNTASGGAAQAADKSVTFAPLVFKNRSGESSVVVAAQGGVRALRGETGQEVWRTSLQGRATSGLAADLEGDGGAEIVVVTEDPNKFYMLDVNTGRVVVDQKLEGEATGAPFRFATGNTRGAAVALKNGRIEIRGADGAVTARAKIDSEITTPPLVVTRGTLAFLVVGTNDGLWALSVPDLKPLGTIKADDDSARGTLAAADLDGDGTTEIVMLTKRGRVALVSTVDGNVRWYAEGATDAATATFADVNGDGILDVIVPGGNDFALAFSGRDGSLVMKVEEGGRHQAENKSDGSLRTLVIAPSLGGGAMLVGGDPAHVGLRAVELPKGSVKAASK